MCCRGGVGGARGRDAWSLKGDCDVACSEGGDYAYCNGDIRRYRWNPFVDGSRGGVHRHIRRYDGLQDCEPCPCQKPDSGRFVDGHCRTCRRNVGSDRAKRQIWGFLLAWSNAERLADIGPRAFYPQADGIQLLKILLHQFVVARRGLELIEPFVERVEQCAVARCNGPALELCQ